MSNLRSLRSARNSADRLDRNIRAIGTLCKIEAEGRWELSEDERSALAGFTGFGGIQLSELSYRRGKLLEAGMTPGEFDAACTSALTGYYTHTAVIDAVESRLAEFGFRDARILEPSCGTGKFIGRLPKGLAAPEGATGVELDPLSARIAARLYPQSRIINAGFQQTTAEDHYDIAVGNVPFGNFAVSDPSSPEISGKSIHNYFFHKALKEVRPGGVVALITSSYMMDSADPRNRLELARKAEFLGTAEIALPMIERMNGGGILLSQPKPAKDGSSRGSGAGKARLNRYFAEHPEMAAGTLVYSEDRFLKPVARCESLHKSSSGLELDTFLSEQAAGKLADCLSRINCRSIRIQQPLANDRAEGLDPAVLKSPEYLAARPYTFFIGAGGALMYKERAGRMPRPASLGGSGAPDGAVLLSKAAMRAVRALCPLRDQFDLIRRMEHDGRDPQEIMPERERLSLLYDSIRSEFGPKADADPRYFRKAAKGAPKAVIPWLLSAAGRGAEAADASFGRLTYLEESDRNGAFKGKAPIFTRMSVAPRKAPDHAETADDALAYSVNNRGRVDPAYMGALLGKDPAVVLADLRSRRKIYRDPDQVSQASDGSMDPRSGWVTADEYLSGNIYRKIDSAREAAGRWDSDEFAAQIRDLEAAKPAPLSASQITAEPGSRWIPAHYYSDFIKELLKDDRNVHDGVITFNGGTGLYVYSTPYGHDYSGDIERGEANTERYGVKGDKRWSAISIWMKILNKQKIAIMEPGSAGEKPKINEELTAVAVGKAREIESAFQNWIFSDMDRRNDLVACYNRALNAIRPRRYDGSGLSFEGMNPAISLRPHQKNAVARTILGGNALFAHAVGAGKTFAMAASAMEKIRLGLARKAMVVVPKPLLRQEAADFAKLYPGARILVPDEGDFSKAGRRNFLNMIAYGDSQIVFVTKEQFAKIPLSISAREEFYKERINQIDRAAAQGAEGFSGRGYGTQKRALQLRKERLRSKLTKAEGRVASNADEAAGLSFEDLGIDALYVDEAHNYKNADLETMDSRIALPAPSSLAEDMQMKCDWLNRKYGNKAIVFATGTPLNNSLVDLFTMQTFLNKPALKDAGVDTLDSFMSTFGVVDQKAEVDATGQRMQVTTRLRSICNIPEAMRLFGEVADIKTNADLKGAAGLPRVRFHYVSTPATKYQRKVLEGFVSRADAIKNGAVGPAVDNMLKLSTDGRKLSLDPRLYAPGDPAASDDPRLKVNQCAARVFKIAQENPGKGQVVFCDYGTPSSESDGGFNLYAELKRKLVSAGMAESDIAFVHDYDGNADKKQALFNDFNDGKIKVLIGSTSKLGTGANIQSVLKAVHHLDINWKPSDIEQRNGRIIRQGNTNPDVDIFFYIGNSTFDSFMFQTVMRKADSFNRVLQGAVHGDQSERSLDLEGGDEAVSYSECMSAATGNPLWGEQAELSSDVKTLEIQQKAFRNHLADMRDEADSRLPGSLARLGKIEASLSAACASLDAHKPELGREGSGKEFLMQVAGPDGRLEAYTDRAKARAALNARIATMRLDGRMKRIASWCGIDVYAELREERTVDIKSINSEVVRRFCALSLRDAATGEPILSTEDYSSRHRLSVEKENHNLRQIAEAFDGLRKGLEETRKLAASTSAKLAETRKYLSSNPSFPQEEELLRKQARLTEVDRILAKEGGKARNDFDPDEKPVETVIDYDPNGYDPDLFKKSMAAAKGKTPDPEAQDQAQGRGEPEAVAEDGQELARSSAEARSLLGPAAARNGWSASEIVTVGNKARELLSFIASSGRIPSGSGSEAEILMARRHASLCQLVPGFEAICARLAAHCRGADGGAGPAPQEKEDRPQEAAPGVQEPEGAVQASSPLSGECFLVKAGEGLAAALDDAAEIDRQHSMPPALAGIGDAAPGVYRISPDFVSPSRGGGGNALILLRAASGYWEQDPEDLFFKSLSNAKSGRPSDPEEIFSKFGISGAIRQERERVEKHLAETGVDLLRHDGGGGGGAASPARPSLSTSGND